MEIENNIFVFSVSITHHSKIREAKDAKYSILDLDLKEAKYLQISMEKAEKEVGGWRVKHCVTVTWRGGLAELGSVRAVRASFKLVVLLEWR